MRIGDGGRFRKVDCMQRRKALVGDKRERNDARNCRRGITPEAESNGISEEHSR